MKAIWLGHGSFEFHAGDHVIVVDPFPENPKWPSGYKIAKCDSIFVTHGHGDHISGVLPLAKEFSPQIFSNYEIATWLQSKGAKNTVGMNKGGTVKAGPVKATMTHAIHSSTIQDGDKMIPAGEPCGYLFEYAPNKCAYFAGDTAVHSDMALVGQLYAPELAFLPIGDHFTMDPKQAALAAKLLGVKTVVPMHYGTFPVLTGTPEQLQALVLPLGVKVQVLTPGEPWNC